MRHIAYAFLLVLAGLNGSADAADAYTAAAEVSRVVSDFCLPTLQGGDSATTASELGAARVEVLTPAQRQWVARSGGDAYYGIPLRKGALLFHAKRNERSAVCAVTLFDVVTKEVDLVYGALDALFGSLGYERIQGRTQPGARPAGYKGDNGSLLVVLSGNNKDTAKAGVQLHILMKRRLYAF